MNNPNNEGQTPTYQGNKIPLVIKIVWAIFVVWLFAYLVTYALPNLKIWLMK